MRRYRYGLVFIFPILFVVFVVTLSLKTKQEIKINPTATYIPYPSSYTSLSISLPTPTATPRPLTFSEMNELYGPCTYLPTLMYHHIENPDIAKAGGFSNLNVVTSEFVNQMHYLKDHGYTTVFPSDLINFFDQGAGLPTKPIMLTFDDGYADFYINAYPLLRELGLKASMFLPTGLMENNRYLSWNQIVEMSSSGFIYFGNHTWSHKSMDSGDFKEIDLANEQLTAHGLDTNKVFVYPYGTVTNAAISYLSQKGYKLAYTTVPGSVMCKKNRLSLPRVRIGNAALGAYGF